MAKRFIDTDFFSHPFVRNLKGTSKLLYCYIICDCSGSGIWIKDLQVASIFVGANISDDDFHRNFVQTGKAFDLQNGKYFFPDFLQHQYPSGLNQKNPAHNNFIKELRQYSLIDENLNISQATLEGLKSGSEATKVMVKVMVKEKVIDKVMVKPTLEEIRNYCIERKNNVDPEKWLAHYESNGWLVGKNKMKDWKASVRTWEKNNYESNGQQKHEPKILIKW